MQPEPKDPQLQSEVAEDSMDFYADSMFIDSSLYTAHLMFGEMRRNQPVLQRVRIRVSPHMLKAISLLTAKHVREFEQKTGGDILLPNELVHEWGLEEEVK